MLAYLGLVNGVEGAEPDSEVPRVEEDGTEANAASASELASGGREEREPPSDPDASARDYEEIPESVESGLQEGRPPVPQGSSARATPQSLDDVIADRDVRGTPPPPPDEPVHHGEDSQQRPRPVPDYDHREPRHLSAGDVLVWVPRTLLYPAHWVMEYVVRRPIVWGVTKVEKWKIAERVREALSWDDGRGIVYPMFNADFGIRPHIGLVVDWERFVPRHDISVAGFGGPRDLWAGSLELRQHLFRDRSARLTYQASYVRRPDRVYFALNDETGPCAVTRRGCRYRTAIAEGHARLTAFEEDLSGVGLDIMLRHANFSTRKVDWPALRQSEAETLAGFETGYLLLRPRLHLVGDTRAKDLDFAYGTGARLEGFSSFNWDLKNRARRWLRGGFEASGFYDFGKGKIIAARLYAEMTYDLRDETGLDSAIPFHELIALGGSDRMRGFLRGRLRGNHAWTATVEYRYPILWALDAGLFASMGNVYESVTDFGWRDNYLNYGLTFRLKTGDRGSTFESVIGFGSSRLNAEPFLPLEQLRLTVGLNQGF